MILSIMSMLVQGWASLCFLICILLVVLFLLNKFLEKRHYTFNLTEKDILRTYAGVRPLVKQEGSVTKASRKDLFHYDKRSGIISVSSKLTQARSVAEKVNNFVLDLIYDKNK